MGSAKLLKYKNSGESSHVGNIVLGFVCFFLDLMISE